MQPLVNKLIKQENIIHLPQETNIN